MAMIRYSSNCTKPNISTRPAAGDLPRSIGAFTRMAPGRIRRSSAKSRGTSGTTSATPAHTGSS